MLESNTPTYSGNLLTTSETVMHVKCTSDPADLEENALECVTEIQDINVRHAQTQVIMKPETTNEVMQTDHILE